MFKTFVRFFSKLYTIAIFWTRNDEILTQYIGHDYIYSTCIYVCFVMKITVQSITRNSSDDLSLSHALISLFRSREQTIKLANTQ